jgi:multicomponent Na+:H+ antiporter subunit C
MQLMEIIELATALTIGSLFGIAIYLLLQRSTIRAVMGLIVLSNAINLFLLSAGATTGLEPAYYLAQQTQSDPLPQALVLTAIVISMGGVAFVLAMLYIIAARYKTSDVEDINGLKY